MYGDPKKPRTIPFAFAQAHRLFLETVTEIQKRVEEKDREDKQNYLNKCLAEKYELFKQFRELRQGVKQAKAECVWQEISHWDLDLGYFDRYDNDRIVKDLVKYYVLLHEYSSVQEVLKPYYTARFTQPWRDKLNITELMRMIMDGLKRLREDNLSAWESKQKYMKKHTRIWFRSFLVDEIEERLEEKRYRDYKDTYYQERFENFLLDEFQKFFKQYGEGAFAVLVLALTAISLQRWRESAYGYGRNYPTPDQWRPQPISALAFARKREFPLPKIWGHWRENGLYERYPGFNMLYLPPVENREPLEIMLLLERLNKVTSSLNFEADCTKYYWLWGCDYYLPEGGADFHYGGNPYRQFDKLKIANLILVKPLGYEGRINDELQKNRDDLQILRKEVARKKDWYMQKIEEGKHWWYVDSEDLVRTYLQCRACDLARYGQKVADLTFPQPTIEGATSRQVADLVASLVTLLQEHSQLNEKQEDEKVLANLKARAQREFDDKFSKQIIPMPDIQLRSLTNSEIEELKRACLKELSQGGWNAQATLNVIEEFVEFCDLLSEPVNHLQKPCMQYIIKEVNTRSYKDMNDEMEQKLMKLNPGTAYVRLIRNEGEVQVRKIKTRKLSEVDDVDARYETVRAQIWESNIKAGYYKERRVIDEEIRRRQEEWRRQIPDSTRQTPPSVEPPPTYY